MYNLKILWGRLATDTFYSDMKYHHGNTCYQVYSHKVGFYDCLSNINAKGGSIGETLDEFVREFGVPEHLTFDVFQSQVVQNTKFKKNLRRYRIDHHISAPLRTNENSSEGAIG